MASPVQGEDARTSAGYGDDIRWLLEQFGAGRPLRINCGGRAEHEDSAGVIWSRDRFFRGGRLHLHPRRIILEAPDKDLYQAYHDFFPEELETFLSVNTHINLG